MQPQARELFLHEARTAARLSHPGIVPIFAVHEVRDFVFFVMAYVDGETLAQRVQDSGPLRPAVAARMLEEVARALAYAHIRGVVHRDVKPEPLPGLGLRNRPRRLRRVLGVTARGGDGGIHESGAGHRRARGRAQRPVFAGCGGILRADRQAPLDGPDAMTVLARHVTDPAPPLARVAPGVPLRLAEAVDRCLAKHPDARFADGNAFAEAVQAALDRRAAVAALKRAPAMADVVAAPWIFGIAAATALLAALVARWRTEHRTDPKTERRLRFWSGPAGAWLFSLAGQRPAPRPQAEQDAIPVSPVPAVTPVPGGGSGAGPDS